MWRIPSWSELERAVKLALGVALVWHQAAIAEHFNPYAFTGGLTLLGATEAIRWDIARRGRNGAGDPPASSIDGVPPPQPSEPVAR